jgi:hypothetical protein
MRCEAGANISHVEVKKEVKVEKKKVTGLRLKFVRNVKGTLIR